MLPVSSSVHSLPKTHVPVQDVVPEDQMKEEIMDSIQKGNFTMRILKDQLQNILKMGPVGQVMGMIPGFGNAMMPKVCVHCYCC